MAKKIWDMSAEEIREAVSKKYGEVASSPQGEFPFPVGKAFALSLGYDGEGLNRLPPSSSESFAGVSNPLAFAELQEGEIVLDLGSGAGLDAILAASQVGPKGMVIGVDMAEEMIAKAEENAELLRLQNVEFRKGYAEQIPVEDEYVDAVLVNGVFNLSPAKAEIAAEAFRVLKPGGRLIASEIVLVEELPDDVRDNLTNWFN